MRATIGSRINARRAALDLSRFQLGSLCGLDPLHIYRWESERCIPNLKSVVLLARGLRVTLDWLVLGRESKYRGKSRAAARVNGAAAAPTDVAVG